MQIPTIYTVDGEIYKRDSKRENRIEIVIQHMWEKGFTYEEIVRMLRIDGDYVRSIIKR